MARSSYIYVVQWRVTGTVLAAFTVKHELADWLGGHALPSVRHVTFAGSGPATSGSYIM
jgi:hypothetical protein